ncbi:hypothetical protein [Paracidovorax anthurii]|uniref:Uncharacterized protein n=1 Tax=Paracidovorax anthurii TaxID=78229 RepID=A0A328ZJU1_9BURK|nr:hypothetical protein [Paracidovorax anthurii]RAR86171.1 hypothetical protein AX018_1002132 [Paracidovorax anthurii]
MPTKSFWNGVCFVVIGLSHLAIAQTSHARTIDTIAFGNLSSESSHRLTTGFPSGYAVSTGPDGQASDVTSGGLSQSARRLLPRTPDADYYGGDMRFTMAVDPEKQNYFTLKVWGTDTSKSWLVLEIDGYEVGGRHMTQDESILLNSSGWHPNRFIYRTVRIPQKITSGRTSVQIRIRSVGEMYYYASGAYDAYQARMKAPTIGLYGAYIHDSTYLATAGEPQGTPPAYKIRTTSTADESNWLIRWKKGVNDQLSRSITAAVGTLAPRDLQYMARAYGADWTTAYQNSTAINQIVAGMDALVTAYAAAPDSYIGAHGNDSWGGYLGPAGDAVRMVWPQVQDRMGETVSYGGSLGTITRKDAWAKALRASVDYGRFNRRTIANQDMYTTVSIYMANSGLLLIDASNALNEQEARRYVYESYGLNPYLGSDLPGGGAVPVRGAAPFGPQWYMVTPKGTTREWCLVSGDYGERGADAFTLGKHIGDSRLVDQGLKMLRARAALRYPAVDSNGYLTSYVTEPIGCRNDHEFTWHVAYLAYDIASVLVARYGADEIGTDLLGYVQQQFSEGQLLPQMNVPNKGYADMVDVPAAYNAFRTMATTGMKLPMTSGQPDFAWADEENRVVAAKHGEERFWAVLQWRATNGINNLARVFTLSESQARLADVSVEDVQYVSAKRNVTRDGYVDNTPPHGRQPPDNPVLANKDEVYPVAMRPDLTKEPPTNTDGGRGYAYTLRYGHWLVALNAHPTQSYTMKAPAGFSGGKDLVSGKTFGATVTLAPASSTVFYLEDTN